MKIKWFKKGKRMDEVATRLEIPKKIESLNKLNKMHWSDRHRYTSDWAQQIFVEHLRKYRSKPKKAKEKRYVQITSLRKRKLDMDNLIGGCKGLVDALKKHDLIVDDSPKWIEVDYSQEIESKNPRTVIEVRGCVGSEVSE